MYIKKYLCIVTVLVLMGIILILFNTEPVDSYEVMVLCYHHIVDREPENDCEIRIEDFEKQMNYLYKNDYNLLSLEDFKEKYNNDSFPEKSVILTFDDGYASFYHKAYPVLKEYQFPAVIFPIVSHTPGLEREVIFSEKLTFNLIRLMDSESELICVGSHSYNLHFYHDGNKPAVFPKPDEKLADYKCRIQKDLRTSRNILELQLDKEIIALAWPFGAFTEAAQEIAVDVGYEFIFTIEPEPFTSEDSITSIPRFTVDAYSLEEFKALFNPK